MVAEQQQFAILLNKVEALTTAVQSLQETTVNNQWPMELATLDNLLQI